jgi:hypothetical protein
LRVFDSLFAEFEFQWVFWFGFWVLEILRVEIYRASFLVSSDAVAFSDLLTQVPRAFVLYSSLFLRDRVERCQI